MDSSSLNGLLSTPLVLPASVAGALAALFVVLAVMALRRSGGAGASRLLLPVALIATIALAVTALLDRMALDERAAERRALLQRSADLAARALAPGSMLSCLDGRAGEVVENACEKAVFADAQSAAAAVAFTAARLTLLKDAASATDGNLLESFAAIRRALELDRFGLAAHVLAERDGCTADHCAAFALLRDTGAVKANMKAQAFDTYVGRYAAAWNKSEQNGALVSEKATQAPALASVPEPQAEPSGHNAVSRRYDFPSAASIPPVSIMNAEPPLPKAAEVPAAVTDTTAVPVPPKRPQAQAATPPAR